MGQKLSVSDHNFKVSFHVRFPSVFEQTAKDCDDNMTSRRFVLSVTRGKIIMKSPLRPHKEGTRNKDRLASELINPNDGRNSGQKHADLVVRNHIPKTNWTYTMPTTPVASREMLFPVRPRLPKIVGA